MSDHSCRLWCSTAKGSSYEYIMPHFRFWLIHSFLFLLRSCDSQPLSSSNHPDPLMGSLGSMCLTHPYGLSLSSENPTCLLKKKKNITITHSSLNSVPTSHFLITIISLNCVSSPSYLFFSFWCLLLLYFWPLPSWRLKVHRKKTVSVVLFVLHFRFLISYDIFFSHLTRFCNFSFFDLSLPNGPGVKTAEEVFCCELWSFLAYASTTIVE